MPEHSTFVPKRFLVLVGMDLCDSFLFYFLFSTQIFPMDRGYPVLVLWLGQERRCPFQSLPWGGNYIVPGKYERKRAGKFVRKSWNKLAKSLTEADASS